MAIGLPSVVGLTVAAFKNKQFIHIDRRIRRVSQLGLSFVFLDLMSLL